MGTELAQKQELVRHIKDEPASLDPAKAVGLPEIQVIRDLYEGLVNQNEKGELVPGVATRWQSNDNRVWTFTLRDNAKWSDGTPVTAQDFVYSWRRLVDPKTTSPFARFAALAGINNAQAIIDGKAAPETLGVTAVDAKTLRVQLDKPLPWFSNLTASFAFYPVQKANVESGKEWTRPGALIGNGAYVLKDRVVNEKLVVEPNTHYWDNANTVLKKSPLCQSTESPQRPNAIWRAISILQNRFRKTCTRSCLKIFRDRFIHRHSLGPITTRLTHKRPNCGCPRTSGAQHDYRQTYYGGKSPGNR